MAPSGIGTEVEGTHAVAAAVAAGRVERLLVERGRQAGLEDLVERAAAMGAEIDLCDDVGDVAVTSAPQGVVALCRPVKPVDLDTAVARSAPTALVVLDRMEDARNVGAIARSAVAAGFTGLVFGTRRAAPLGATAFKAAAGALEHLDLVEVTSIADAVAQLARRSVWTVGLEAEAEDMRDMALLSEPVAVVVGAEGAGLSRLVRDRCDVLAGIPIDPQVESLNASVAAALALFEVARVRGVGH